MSKKLIKSCFYYLNYYYRFHRPVVTVMLAMTIRVDLHYSNELTLHKDTKRKEIIIKETAIAQTVSLNAVLLVQKIWSETSVNLEATINIIKLHDHIILNLQRLWSHATIISFQTISGTVTISFKQDEWVKKHQTKIHDYAGIFEVVSHSKLKVKSTTLHWVYIYFVHWLKYLSNVFFFFFSPSKNDLTMYGIL